VERPAGAARPSQGSPFVELPAEVRDRLSDELIDELLAGARTEEEIVGPGGLLADLTRRLVERAMSAELTEHLGYEPHQEPPGGTGNTRNATSPKTLATEHGPVQINTPRDRNSSFEPKIVRKGQRRFQGFDDKILALYSRGLSVRDIEAHLGEIYGVSVGRDLISRVTDAVMEDVRAWQQRPLEDVYPVVFLDCLVLKIREGGTVQRRACYLALGVTVEGERDVLGMWFQETEGAKFWMQVVTDLKQRGVQDILICCVDALKGFPEAIEAIFPKTVVQTCVVHLIRHSLKYVPRREREQVARDLKPIYNAVDADAAAQELERFDEKWGKRFPVITQAWLNAWEYVIAFLAFPPEVRRVIYTTNAIEALNRQLRKAIKTKGQFPNEQAARKLIYLAVTNAVPQWTRTRNWTTALLAFKIHFGDRLPGLEAHPAYTESRTPSPPSSANRRTSPADGEVEARPARAGHPGLRVLVEGRGPTGPRPSGTSPTSPDAGRDGERIGATPTRVPGRPAAQPRRWRRCASHSRRCCSRRWRGAPWRGSCSAERF
jgi:putative transposase